MVLSNMDMNVDSNQFGKLMSKSFYPCIQVLREFFRIWTNQGLYIYIYYMPIRKWYNTRVLCSLLFLVKGLITFWKYPPSTSG